MLKHFASINLFTMAETTVQLFRADPAHANVSVAFLTWEHGYSNGPPWVIG